MLGTATEGKRAFDTVRYVLGSLTNSVSCNTRSVTQNDQGPRVGWTRAGCDAMHSESDVLSTQRECYVSTQIHFSKQLTLLATEPRTLCDALVDQLRRLGNTIKFFREL